MAKCFYCYEETLGNADFHEKCAKFFFGSKQVPVLPYRQEEIEELALMAVQRSVTVPGVQPKLSLGFIKDVISEKGIGRLTILDALEGLYILKPQNQGYEQMPENEHLTMLLAQLFRIEVVPCTLIRMQSGELCYLTKRIDRNPDLTKRHMIDFLQILALSDKYLGTMEKLGKEIALHSTNTLLDTIRFFELTVFNYVVGNNDMHLKNFSMLLSDTGWVLSPAYDLVNVKLILPKDKEEMALMLGGKKVNLNKGYFDRMGTELGLNGRQMGAVYLRLKKWMPQALNLINRSFLSEERKQKYAQLITERSAKF